MSFLDTIERVQRSSPGTRRTILIISVTLIMAIIVGIWTTQLKYELQKDTESPYLSDSFGSVWKNIKEKAPTLPR